jgi:hypothetical protein
VTPRNSRITEKAVIYGFWLVFEEAGGIRLTRVEPNLDRAERAMYVQATLPRSLWRTIDVSGDTANPVSIDLQVAHDALKAALGVDIEVRAVGGDDAR